MKLTLVNTPSCSPRCPPQGRGCAQMANAINQTGLPQSRRLHSIKGNSLKSCQSHTPGTRCMTRSRRRQECFRDGAWGYKSSSLLNHSVRDCLGSLVCEWRCRSASLVVCQGDCGDQFCWIWVDSFDADAQVDRFAGTGIESKGRVWRCGFRVLVRLWRCRGIVMYGVVLQWGFAFCNRHRVCC